MFFSKLAGFALALVLAMDPFAFEFSSQTDVQGRAHMVIRANEAMPTGVSVTITGDGQTIQRSVPKLRAGGTHKISWTQKSKLAKYQLKITGGDMETDFEFEVRKAIAGGKVGKLQPLSSREDIVKHKRSKYRTSFALSSYKWMLYNTKGDAVREEIVTDNPVPPGGTFEIQWQTEDVIFMIYVRAEDDLGRFTEYKLVPWSVEIPHTEVNFDSGKWNIKPDEAKKVDEAVAVAFHELVALDQVNKAVGANLTPQLYIVGYTDTVGSSASNQELSDNRAKAIAKYFYDKGFWAEIHAAGMGERGLRVETDDQVDEVRNRRALYLLGVQKPAAGGQIPARWTKVANARTPPAGFVPPPLPERWKNYKEEQEGRSGKVDASVPDDEGGGGGGTVGSAGETTYPDDLGDEDYDIDEGGPPEIEGEPGATKKGCSVAGQASMPVGSFVLLCLLGLRRRRQ